MDPSSILLGGGRRRRRRAAAQLAATASAISPDVSSEIAQKVVSAPLQSVLPPDAPVPVPASKPKDSSPGNTCALPSSSSVKAVENRAKPSPEPSPVNDYCRELEAGLVRNAKNAARATAQVAKELDGNDSDATLPPPESMEHVDVPEFPANCTNDVPSSSRGEVSPDPDNEVESDTATLPPPSAELGNASTVPEPVSLMQKRDIQQARTTEQSRDAERSRGDDRTYLNPLVALRTAEQEGVKESRGEASKRRETEIERDKLKFSPDVLKRKRAAVALNIDDDDGEDDDDDDDEVDVARARQQHADQYSAIAVGLVKNGYGGSSTNRKQGLDVLSSGQMAKCEVNRSCIADIVKVNYGGLEERERILKEEEEEKEKSWGSELYPRIPLEAAFVSDANVEELVLSNRPEHVRHGRPVGVVPARVNRFLKPYQREGVMFLFRLFERGRGGLLADAMGLGKTVQMIVFLGAMTGVWDRLSKDRSVRVKSSRILICAPASVQENWKREIETWSPFRVEMFNLKTEVSLKASIENDEVDIVLVTERKLRDDLDTSEGEKRLKKISWDCLVIDECHIAKNGRSQIRKALIDVPARLKFGMSGTIIQNKLEDLHYVMEILVPPELRWPDKKTFDREFTKPIRLGSSKDASNRAKVASNQARRKLRHILAKHCIRRPKAIIESDIPPKTDSLVSLVMSRDTLQGRMWVKFINSYDAHMVRSIKEPCDCGSRIMSKACCHAFPTTAAQLENAPLWRQKHRNGDPCEHCPNCLQFRVEKVGGQISCHALMLYPSDADEKVESKSRKADEDSLTYRDRLELVEHYSSGEINALTPILSMEKQDGMSCKLSVALRLICKFRSEGHKTIVFYENLRLGGILMRWAVDNSIGFKKIDGSVAADERQAIIDQFQSAPVNLLPLFFVSKLAGSTGLNITSADRVLIFEPSWNPTQDLQAQDRAHRIGQRNTVKVYRMAVKDTIEEYKTRTAIQKNQMSNSVMDNITEESRVRSCETGSMKAMLRIGPGFHLDDVSDGTRQGHMSAKDCPDFTVENIDMDIREHRNSLESAEGDMCVFEEDTVLCEPDVDAGIIHFEGKRNDSQPGDGEFEAEADERLNALTDLSETQDVDNIMLEENPANRRQLYASNEEKHRRHSQLVRMAAKGSGGVNGKVGDVGMVDLEIRESDLSGSRDDVPEVLNNGRRLCPAVRVSRREGGVEKELAEMDRGDRFSSVASRKKAKSEQRTGHEQGVDLSDKGAVRVGGSKIENIPLHDSNTRSGPPVNQTVPQRKKSRAFSLVDIDHDGDVDDPSTGERGTNGAAARNSSLKVHKSPRNDVERGLAKPKQVEARMPVPRKVGKSSGPAKKKSRTTFGNRRR